MRIICNRSLASALDSLIGVFFFKGCIVRYFTLMELKRFFLNFVVDVVNVDVRRTRASMYSPV